METTLENPVIKDESLDTKFLEAAALADKGEDIPADLVPGAKSESPTDTAEVEQKPADKPDNSEAEPDKAKERPRDAQGRFTKTETGEDIPEDQRAPAEQPKAQQTPSEYEAKKQERKQKEQERLEKTWENVNKRKEELEQRERELAQRAQQAQQPPQQPQARLPYSSQELFQAAEDYEAKALKALNEGDYDQHGENLTLARSAREQGKKIWQIEAEQAEQINRERFDQEWKANAQPILKEHPELLQSESPLAQSVMQIFKDNPFLNMLPDGLAKAVEVVKLKMEAGAASELREANKKLQAELDEMRQRTGIGGGGVTASRPAPKKLEDMNSTEAEQFLMRQAALHDAGHT